MGETMPDKRVDTLLNLAEAGVVHYGVHVEHADGKHGTCWIDADVLFTKAKLATSLILRLGKMLKDKDIDVIVGLGRRNGNMAFVLADYLSKNKDVGLVYGDRHSKGIFLSGSTASMAGKHVLIITDIIMTGKTAAILARLVRTYNPASITLGTMCNGGDVQANEVGVDELVALFEANLAISPEKCILCHGAEKRPVEKCFFGNDEVLDRR